MKKTTALLLSLYLLAALLPSSAFAAEPAVPADVVIYAIDSWAEPYLTIPCEFPQSYLIEPPDGAMATFRKIKGKSVDVSDDGLVTPHSTTRYWFGNVGYNYIPSGKVPDRITRTTSYGVSVVRMTMGTKTTDISIEVKNYATSYAEGVIDKWIAENISDDMTFYEKLEKICQFPAKYDYNKNFQSGLRMVVSGGGDCWASSSLIVLVCEKLGIEAKVRNANRDPASASGHRNALITFGEGDYYELEAGYPGTAPRRWSIKHRTSLFCYRDYGKGIEVYQYDGDTTGVEKMTVPDSIDAKTVFSLGRDFISADKNLVEVVLPDTVENIGQSAFNSCVSLRKLHLPASLKSVGTFAFTNCGNLVNLSCSPENPYLTLEDGILYDKAKTNVISAPCCEKAVLPDMTETVGAYAFYYNPNLTSIVLGSGTKALGEGALANCSRLHKTDLRSVRTIGKAAFGSCRKLADVLIPDGVSEIGELAFDNTGLGSVCIPASVARIGANAFHGCPLSDVCCAGSEEQWNAVEKAGCGIPESAVEHFNCVTYVLTINDGETISEEKHYNAQLVSLRAADNDPEMRFDRWMAEDGLKVDNQYLHKTTATMPARSVSVTALYEKDPNYGSYTPESAFVFNNVSGIINGLTDEGKALAGIVIPRRIGGVCVNKIADGAFRDCSGLKAVSIPKTVTDIGSEAFMNCTALENIAVPDSVGSVGESAFEGCASLSGASLGCSVTSVGKNAFANCPELSYSHYGNAKYLGNETDAHFVLVEAEDEDIPCLEVHPKAKVIADRALAGCASLGCAFIPEGVTSIGSGAFYGCVSLGRVILPGTLTNFGSCAFSHCCSLTGVILKNGIETIGSSAFECCCSLDSVTIPLSVKKIGDNAFYNCCLGKVYYAGTEEQWNAVEQSGCCLDCCADVRFSSLPPEMHLITVSGGTADKSFALKGDVVTVTACPVAFGFEFCGWTGNVTFADPTAEVTSFTMPDGAAEVEACFVELFGLACSGIVAEKRIEKSADRRFITTNDGITVGVLVSEALEVGACTVRDESGAAVGEDALAATGMTVEDDNGQTITIVVRGDLDGNGCTNNLDVVRLLRVEAALIETPKFLIQACDLTGDGKADNLDAALMLEYDAGIKDKF